MNPIAELIHRGSRWYGESAAVTGGGKEIGFRELDRRSNRLANALAGLSPGTGQRVGVLLGNRAEYVEIDFAIAKAGKVRSPINPRLVAREREWILTDTGADTLIFESSFAPFVESVVDKVEELRHLIVIDGEFRGAHQYESLLEEASDRPPAIDVELGAPSFILYTSGTTGRPKGATSTVRGRLAATTNMLSDEIDARPGDAMAHLGAMAHGSGSKVLAYYLRGARNVPVPKFDPEAFLRLMLEERITATFLVPTMIAMLVDAADGKPVADNPLRNVSYGGAPITAPALEAAMHCFGNVFVQVYGSCEAPHPALVLPRHEHLVDAEHRSRLTSVGREVTNVSIRLADDEGNPVEPGQNGEMWIRGANVMQGYWENQEATEAVLRDGWYRSGDVARQDEDGLYYIVDRARDMIISGGLNIYPAEIEGVIAEHPDVREVAVVGVPDDRWGEAVKAFVVPRGGTSIEPDSILAICREGLAGYKKPRYVEFVDDLPKGSTGKILKRELVSADWEGRDRHV
ncbi:MAG TPA: AMP-binding protein [Solirubrobacterales bacterium]|jgi:acyl-CoA synthetase (AMP-forming)/AMP-acid ligase II|nr:AMP-binding protein [Solirubrobacterales bacterium]